MKSFILSNKYWRKVSSKHSHNLQLNCLYLHGLGESGHYFEPTILEPQLSDYHHWVVDLAGYGKSLASDTPLTLKCQAQQLVVDIQKLQLNHLIVIGHSMGGVIGTYLIPMLKDKNVSCLGFINIEGNISPGDCTQSRQASEHSLQEFMAGGVDQIGNYIFEQGITQPAFKDYYPSYMYADKKTFYQHSKELVELSEQNILAKLMAELTCTKYYIAGVPGGAAKESLQQLEAQQIPTIKIQPSGHWPFIDDFAQFIQQFKKLINLISKNYHAG